MACALSSLACNDPQGRLCLPGKTYRPPPMKIILAKAKCNGCRFTFEYHQFHHKLINVDFFQTIENNAILFSESFIKAVIDTFSGFTLHTPIDYIYQFVMKSIMLKCMYE